MRPVYVLSELHPEKRRRAIIRVSTSLLNLILGPSLAWATGETFFGDTDGGFLGLGIYVFIHLYARFTAAYFASRSAKRANDSYKRSPLLLTFAGIFCIFNELSMFSLYFSFVLAVVLVPILLGAYEGAYWCSYHGIDTAHNNLEKKLQEKNDEDSEEEKSDLQEQEDKRMQDFQRLEVLATILAAFTVLTLKEALVPWIHTVFTSAPSTEILACSLACALATYASIRHDTDTACLQCLALGGEPCVDINGKIVETHDLRAEIPRSDRSPKSRARLLLNTFPVQLPIAETEQDWYRGKSITGMTGVMQWSVQQSMRIVSLSSGGVTLLSLYVALAGLVGWFISERRQDFVKSKSPDEKHTASHDVWIWSNWIAMIGITVMIAGIFYSDPFADSPFPKLVWNHYSSIWLFTFGWFIAQASISGSLRKVEPTAANTFLKFKNKKEKHEGTLIGIRERMKFERQVHFSIGIAISYPLFTLIGIANFKWASMMLLCWSIGVGLYNTIIIGPWYLDRLKSS